MLCSKLEDVDHQPAPEHREGWERARGLISRITKRDLYTRVLEHEYKPGQQVGSGCLSAWPPLVACCVGSIRARAICQDYRRMQLLILGAACMDLNSDYSQEWLACI